jgi:hypothetical protein
LPLQVAACLRVRLLEQVSASGLDTLLAEVEAELADRTRRGLTFTYVQTWARFP